jgi:hypothetical protein
MKKIVVFGIMLSFAAANANAGKLTEKETMQKELSSVTDNAYNQSDNEEEFDSDNIGTWSIEVQRKQPQTASTSSSCKSSCGIMAEVADLKPYYTAIQQIRAAIDKPAAAVNQRTGFESWPTPNPFYSRTPKYMFLETALNRDGAEVLVDLYTPFGEVKLLGGGCLDTIEHVSKTFLNEMDWEIEDVTKKVKLYSYSQTDDRRYGPFPFKEEEWKGSGRHSKLYLIKRVGPTHFFGHEASAPGGASVPTEEELFYYSNVGLKSGQYEKDKAQFEELSGKKNAF